MSTTTLRDNDPKEFLNWLKSRLIHKYQEDKLILEKISDIIDRYYFVNKCIDINFIDNVCKKYFIDFDFEYDKSTGMGLTEDFKNKLRYFVINIIQEVGAEYISQNNSSIDFELTSLQPD